MSNLVLLDIDGVLLPWHQRAVHAISIGGEYEDERTGFSDWTRVDRTYFTFVSKDQLDLISRVGEIRWLTTWALHGIASVFEEITGFGPYDPYPRKHYTMSRFGWWKADVFKRWLEADPEYFASFDRVIWVDDDMHALTHTELSGLRSELGRFNTGLVTVKPKIVWDRESISQWLENGR